MITVIRHGDTFETQDPSTGAWTEMTNVVFIEKGRDGVNKTLSESSKLLGELIGAETGLDNTRTHTQPVRSSTVAQFPVGQEIPNLHINREMWSLPQMANQEDKAPRIIDGKVTYFKTTLSKIPEDDKDFRTIAVPVEEMVPKDLLNQATRTLRATQVRTIRRATSPAISDQDMSDMRGQA